MNTADPGRPQMTLWRMGNACCINKATETYTLTICNTYCFFTATIVAKTRLDATLYLHWQASYILDSKQEEKSHEFLRVS